MDEIIAEYIKGRDNWCVVNGNPHRHEIGDFILRWATAGSPSRTILITGPCDRPFKSFLEKHNIEWIKLESLKGERLHPLINYSRSLNLPMPTLGGQNVERADLYLMGTALLEGDMENFLYQFPKHLATAIGEILEVSLLKKQYSIHQGRPDIICADANDNVCIIEIKRGELRRSHIGQLIEYFRPKDPELSGARLILLLNSANEQVAETLKEIDLEVCIYNYKTLVSAMFEEGYSPLRRENYLQTTGTIPISESLLQAPSWKREFLEGFRNLLPSHLVDELSVKFDYKPPKKLRVGRTSDDYTVLYVASNAGRLEFGLPIIHRLLMAGVPIDVMNTKGPAVFLSRGGQVPNITIEVKANNALEWIAFYHEEFFDAFEHYNDGLDQDVINAVLLHFGATIQDSNASKLQATGECLGGNACVYCMAHN